MIIDRLLMPDAHETSDLRGAALEWLPVLAGLLLLYGPTFDDLARTLWQTDDTQGPLILAISAWVTFRERRALLDRSTQAAPVVGIALLISGLVLYVLPSRHQARQYPYPPRR